MMLTVDMQSIYVSSRHTSECHRGWDHQRLQRTDTQDRESRMPLRQHATTACCNSSQAKFSSIDAACAVLLRSRYDTNICAWATTSSAQSSCSCNNNFFKTSLGHGTALNTLIDPHLVAHGRFEQSSTQCQTGTYRVTEGGISSDLPCYPRDRACSHGRPAFRFSTHGISLILITRC